MNAIVQGQGLRPVNIAKPQLPVQMRKQITTARWLPFQGGPQRLCLDSQQHEVIGPREMPRCCLCDLIDSREMYKPVGHINRCPRRDAILSQIPPLPGTKNLVNLHDWFNAAQYVGGQANWL